MNRVIYAIDQISKTVGHVFAWCIVILMLGTSWEVFVRYVLDDPTSWAFDFSYIMYGALFFMAGATGGRTCRRARRPASSWCCTSCSSSRA
jgi:TRAP-type mannitol/chloroaromatic compound transport system permease small subunit